MSRNNLVIIGVLATLAVMSGVLIYLIKADKLADLWFEGIITQTKDVEEATEEETVHEESRDVPVYQETFLIKDGFSIILPAGWQEIALDSIEVLLMAVDVTEEITDEKAIEAEFMTNLSIKSDDFKKYEKEYTFEEYVYAVKENLTQSITIIEFTYGNTDIIDGNETFFLEIESTQNEVSFKTLLVFIKDSNNIVWVMSFNTLRDSWLAYKDLFYQITENFKLN